jgi:hypothetical protein
VGKVESFFTLQHVVKIVSIAFQEAKSALLLKESWPNVNYYHGIHLGRLKKTKAHLGQDSLQPIEGPVAKLSCDELSAFVGT